MKKSINLNNFTGNLFKYFLSSKIIEVCKTLNSAQRLSQPNVAD